MVSVFITGKCENWNSLLNKLRMIKFNLMSCVSVQSHTAYTLNIKFIFNTWKKKEGQRKKERWSTYQKSGTELSNSIFCNYRNVLYLHWPIQ